MADDLQQDHASAGGRTFWQRHRWWIVGRLSWRRLGASVAFVYVFLLAFGLMFGDRYLFRPQPPGYAAEADWVLRIPVAGEESIAAVWMPVENPRCVVLYCHGNADDLAGVRPLLRMWNARDVSAFSFDYRGYGRSDGRVGEANTYADVTAAYRYLVETLDVPAERILVVGRSLGGGPALYLATTQRIGGLVLESTFTSAFRVVTRVPLIPFDRYPNAVRIGRIEVPVLVIHGDADRTIAFHHGVALHRFAPEPKRFLHVEGAGHADLLPVAGRAYWEAIDDLILEMSR